ncbi:hypothetical protein P4O66_010713 [Electrophorus voltai]|uniref:DNA-directed RNA polymerase III subunit RPC4 n=2 Tax=Electrophorus TaxID=8004 RepID=A0A4W4DXH1_ELEEL|nr:DNA-directed RNA polymerase III subunit RPC4 [Electrophorus electricus]KAK1794027.1 hypothetical protein P4O66_010713 [Electrophorus voltai]
MSAPGEAAPAAVRSPCALGRGLATRLLSPPPPGRLTSLRSRDLTLGGYKKKTFIPNVHSIRKSKDELKEESRTAPKKERREREDRPRERRRRERPQTIQSHSIFEQGPADSFRKIGSWGSTSLSVCDPALITKSIKKERNVPEDDDSEILQKLQRDDFLDDPGLKNDPKQRPIRLPLYQSCKFLTTETATSTPRTHHGMPLQASGTCPSNQPPTVGELFQQLCVSDREELFFIQLPDTIPGPLKTASCDKSAKKEGKADDKRIKAQDQSEKEAASVLSDFPEGPVGKLQIRKSGKVQLLVGNVTLDVSEGAAFSFLQQLVCVRLTEGLTGDMTVLGNVKYKLVCSPDFEALLQGVKGSSNTHSAAQL